MIRPRVVEGVALERQPDTGVERLHLRHRVGDVHRVAVAERGLVRLAPDRILAARHVPAREQRCIPVALVADLLTRGNAWIEPPRGSLETARRAAVDVAGAENAEAPASAHDDGEVLVLELGFLAAHSSWKREDVVRVPDLRQRHVPADKRRVVTSTPHVVGRHVPSTMSSGPAGRAPMDRRRHRGMSRMTGGPGAVGAPATSGRRMSSRRAATTADGIA